MGREFAWAPPFDVDAGLNEAATRCGDIKGRVDKCTNLLLFISASHNGTVMQSARGRKDTKLKTYREKRSCLSQKKN